MADLTEVAKWSNVEELAEQIAEYAMVKNLKRTDTKEAGYEFTDRMMDAIKGAYVRRGRIVTEDSPFIAGARLGKVVDGSVFLDNDDSETGLVVLYTTTGIRLKLGFAKVGGKIEVDWAWSVRKGSQKNIPT